MLLMQKDQKMQLLKLKQHNKRNPTKPATMLVTSLVSKRFKLSTTANA